ncbi:CBN-PRO-1 protein [Caenorhabditis brenneri]|uniref:Pre-rRNA-processing protein pro-1 n=1 Tax=Caenorhabditis brenneri TaxID=135651 RepID=G0MVP1_CAEBE|nr:CBN-PRO-1 protein [Caenorhabditis brenneri]
MAYLGVDTSRIAGTQPLEMLLVSSGSPDPHSTIIIDPRTGVSSWSYKGSELQGASTGLVEPLGESGEHIVVTTKERPLVHVLAVHPKDRFHQKCVLPGPVSAIVSDHSGRLLFMSIKRQLYCWLLSTGELLSVIDAHYQNITNIVISDDDSMVFSASKDGTVHGYLVTELVSADRDHTVAPFRKWASHTLSISDLKITHGSNPRVLSTGADHIVCLHSISIDSVILKASADRPLTACAIDSAETRIFIGTEVGNIAQINLFQLGPEERELLVQAGDEHNTKFRVLNGHSDEIAKITVNTDGTLLASGDTSGKYCIWEISSHQCLKVSTMRSTISTLRFIPYWKALSGVEHAATFRPIWDLRREPTKCDRLAIEVSEEFNSDQKHWSDVIEGTIDQMLLECGSKSSAQLQWEAEAPVREEMEKAEKAQANANDDVITLGDDDDDAPEVGNQKRKNGKNKKNKKNKKKANGDLALRNELIVHEPETVIIDDGEEANQKINELQDSMNELRAENEKLKEINRQMYEFVAKEIVDSEK